MAALGASLRHHPDVALRRLWSGTSRHAVRRDRLSVRSSAWMNRNGPPSAADCHWFEEATICLKFGMMRYSGSSATPSRSKNSRWRRKFAAVRNVHHDRGLAAEELLRGLQHRHSRRVNANHWSSDRFGSSATMRATLASGGAVVSGKRRLRHAFCWKMSIGCTSLSAWNDPSGRAAPAA